MELRQMYYIMAVAKIGSMTKAAETIRVSQSTLSLAYREVERELGVKLFRREGRHLVKTEAGEAFCRRADEILRSTDNLYAAMKKFRDSPETRISLSSDAQDLSTEAVMVYSGFFPQVRFEQRQFAASDVANILRSSTVDVVLTLADMSNSELVSHLLMEEPLLAVVKRGEPLARQESCSLAELAQYPLVTLQSPYALNTLHRSLFQVMGLAPNGVVEVGDTTTTLFQVSMGHGISFIPESAYYHQIRVLHNFLDSVAALPVSSPLCRRSVYLTVMRNKENDPATEGFVEFLGLFSSLSQRLRSFPLPDAFRPAGKYRLELAE